MSVLHYMLMTFIAILTFVSCGSEKTEDDILRELSNRVKLESQINMNRLITSKQEETFESFVLKDTAPLNLSTKICNAINLGTDLSLFFERSAIDTFKETIKGKCISSNKTTRTFPTMVMKLTYTDQEISYLLRFNKLGKIKSLSSFSSGGIKISREKVLTRDGNALSVYSFLQKRKKSSTFFIRTASMQSKTEYYGELIRLVLSQKVNLVIEEIRGSRNSEGTLSWLGQNSTKDAEDVIKWIKSNKLSDGKVIAFGEGHDALMALAAGIGKEKLQSVISCSAPIGLDKKYTYAMLEFLWESRAAQKINDFNNKVNFLRLQNIKLSEIDKYLFGQEIDDYQNFMASSKAYWANQNLDRKLKSIKYPVVHVAGLNGDPTSTGLFKMYKSFTANNRHAFYLHKGGFGCGDITSSRSWPLYVTGNARRPHMSRYFKKINRHKSVSNIKDGVKVKKVYFDFQKPALFSIYPELEMFFDSQNVSALSLDNFRHSIEAKADTKSSFIINGTAKYNIGIKTEVTSNESREVQFGLTLEDDSILTGTDTLVHEQVSTISATSASTLVSLDRNSILKFKLRPKIPNDFSSKFNLSMGSSNNLNKVLVIPYTKASQRPYVNITIEDL